MNTNNSVQFAKLAGASVKTLQRWDREGRLKPAARTLGNRRLDTPEQLNQFEDQTGHDRIPAGFQSGAKTGSVQPESRARTILDSPRDRSRRMDLRDRWRLEFQTAQIL